MGIQMKECCVDCNAYTERAGKSDDSLYLDDGSGPYCLPCYDHHRVEELQKQLDTLHGRPFSSRVYEALVARADDAESRLHMAREAFSAVRKRLIMGRSDYGAALDAILSPRIAALKAGKEEGVC